MLTFNRYNKNSLFRSLFLILLVSITNCMSATWYLDPSKQDGGDGLSADTAFNTIDVVNSTASNGDTVKIIKMGDIIFSYVWDNQLANYKSGISVLFEGQRGVDWAEEYLWYNKKVDDHKIVYIKDTTKLMLLHNEINSIQEVGIVGPNGQDAIPESGDEGIIRYRFDRQFSDSLSGEYLRWAQHNDASLYPAFTEPLQLKAYCYLPDDSQTFVVGTISDDPRDTRGVIGPFGDEWHTLAYADDDSFRTVATERTASDGKQILLVVNPKTPCVSFFSQNVDAQFYTTPAKTYFTPIIHPQTTYISGSVNMVLNNIMDDRPCYYKFDSGNYQLYQDPVDLSVLADGEHTFFYYYNLNNVKSRTIIKNPSHPGINEKRFDEQNNSYIGHGYLLWKNEDEFNDIVERVNGLIPETKNMYELLRDSDYSNKHGGEYAYEYESNERNKPISSLSNVFVAEIEGYNYIKQGEVKPYAEYAKEMLLDNIRVIDPLGFGDNIGAPNPCLEINYRGYYDVDVIFQMAFTYDLMCKKYRSDLVTGGITPVEEYKIRDTIAAFCLENLVQLGDYYGYSKLRNKSGMWGAARQMGMYVCGLAMPSYNTPYYGTSGFDGVTKATHLNTPYPNDPKSWKDVLTSIYDPSVLSGYPNQAHNFGLYEQFTNEELLRGDETLLPAGSYTDRLGYYGYGLMGHCFYIYSNTSIIAGLPYDYPSMDLAFMNANQGVLYGVKYSSEDDLLPRYFPQLCLVNHRFPNFYEAANSYMVSFSEDDNNSISKQLWQSGVFGICYYNPNWQGKPNAKFNISSDVTRANENIVFDASETSDSNGYITNYNWNFGDSNLATGKIVTHAYASDGLHEVTLTVTDDEGFESIEKKNVIIDNSILPGTLLNLNFNKNLLNYSSYYDTYSWFEEENYVDSIFQQSARFDGKNCIKSPECDYLNNISSCTVSVWLNPFYIDSTEDNYILNAGSLRIYFDNGKLSYYLMNENNEHFEKISIENLPLNEWSYVCFVYNGVEARLYVNGNIVPSSDFLFSGKIMTSKSIIIGAYTESRHFYNGDMDNLQIFNKVLTTDEIGIIYNSPPPQVVDLQVNAAGDTSQPIQWNTNEAASSVIDYWPKATSKSGGSLVTKTVTSDVNPSTSHSITLTDLTPGTEYSYSITCIDEFGNSETYEDVAYTFTTAAANNQNPVGVGDTLAVVEDTAAVSGVLTANDSDADGDGLVITGVSQGSKGSVVNNGNGTVTYTPTANVNGSDSFTYDISDGRGGTATATVAVTIAAVNDAPLAGAALSMTVSEDSAKVSGDLTANASDIEGDTLTVSGVSAASHGLVTNNGDGTATYAPSANYYGADSFSFIISDGNGGTTTSTMNVTVTNVNDLPAAANDTIIVTEDNAKVSGNLLSNDTDIDGDTLSISLVGQGSNGTVTNNGNGTVTYQPAANFTGSDSFTYLINDGNGGTATATVNVFVSAVNDVPIAVNDVLQANEDTAKTSGSLVANDTDADNDTLTVQSVTQGAHGTVTNNGNGTVTYTPAANYSGSDSFSYTVSDGNGGTDSAQVSVTIAAVNDGPSASNDTLVVDEDTAKTSGNLLSNDSDADNDSLSITAVTQGSHGTVTNNGNGTVTYTPSANYSGPDTFTYTVSDGNGSSDIGTVSVTVSSSNDVPVAVNDTVSTNEDSAVTSGNLLANDTDSDNDSLSISAVTQGSHGSVVNNGDGTVSYTPEADYYGLDSFTYTVSDGNGGTANGTVNVTIAAQPDAPVITAAANQALVATQRLTFSVSATDKDNDGVSFTFSTLPAGAKFADNGDGTATFDWTSGKGQAGDYTIQVTAKDDSAQALTATKSIKISVGQADNNLPVLAEIGTKTVTEMSQLIFTVSATDADGDTLTYSCDSKPAGASFNTSTKVFSWTPDYSAAGASPYTAVISVNDGFNGTDSIEVTINVNNLNRDPQFGTINVPGFKENALTSFTVSATDADGDTLTYSCSNLPDGASLNPVSGVFSWKPGYDDAGMIGLQLVVTDSNNGTDTITANVTVGNVNAFPTAVNDNVITNEDVVKVISNLLANDIDEDNDSLTITSVTQGTHGTVVNNGNGVVTYTPSANYSGSDTFTYVASDGNGGTSTATVNITISAVNDIPAAANDSLVANEDTVLISSNLLSNDSDLDGDTLSISSVSQGSKGSVVNNGDGTITYTPSANVIGTDSFTYTVNDGNGGSDTASVSVLILPINDIPTAVNDTLITSEDVAVTGSLTGNDTDVEGDSLSISSITQGTNGSVTNNGNGTVTYTPSSNYNGTDSFTYTVNDGHGGTAVGTVNVTVKAVADSPIISASSSKSVIAQETLSFSVTASDADNDNISFSFTGVPSGATFVDNGNGTASFSWTPNKDQANNYTVVVTATDDSTSVKTAEKTIVISVSEAGNNLPVFAGVTAKTVTEMSPLSFSISATDADGDALTYSCTSKPSGAVFNASTKTFSWTPDYDASGSSPYTAEFKVDDGFHGSDSLEVVIYVNNLNRNPVFGALSVPGFKENTENSFALAATDEDGDTLSYSSSNLPTGASLNSTSGLFSWKPGYSDSGSKTVLFTVTDSNGGSASKTVTLGVEDVNRNPEFTSSSAYSVTAANKLKFTVYTKDPDGDTVSVVCNSMPSGAAFDSSSNSFAWIPDAGTQGSYSAKFTATDSKGGSNNLTVSIAVGLGNQAPTFTPVSVSAVDETDTVTFTAKAIDPDGDIVTYSLKSSPLGATISSGGTVTWQTGYDDAGIQSFIVTASDGSLTADLTVSVTVNNLNRKPEINVSGDVSPVYTDGLSLTVKTSDQDGDGVTVSANNLPSGATYNSKTGKITWQPDRENIGNYQIILVASDGITEVSKTIDFSITDDPDYVVNHPPVFVEVPDKQVDEGGTIVFAIQVTDPDNDSLTIEAVGMPSGAVFVNNTFSWLTTSSDIGNHSVTFVASDGQESVSMPVNMEVTNVNVAPVVSVKGATKLTAGEPVSLTIDASDEDGDSLIYSLKNEPKGMNIEGNMVTWPTSESDGGSVYKITVVVSDGKLSTNVAVTISVAAAASDKEPPFIVSTYPENGGIQIPLNPLITFTLADYGEGVDYESVTISVDGVNVFTGGAMSSEADDSDQVMYSSQESSVVRTGTASRYTFQYQAVDMFDYDYTPDIVINAKDMQGNQMEPYSFSFTTEMFSMAKAVPVEQTKSSSTETSQSKPAVAVSSAGIVWSAWNEGTSGSRKIKFAPYYDNTGQFDTSRVIPGIGDMTEPDMAASDSGELYFVWQNNISGNWDIYIGCSSDGISMDMTTTVSTGEDEQTQPVIAVADSGDIYIAYVVKRKTGKDIYVAKVSSDLTSVIESPVCTNSGDQISPVIASGSDGDIHIAWEDYRDGSTSAVYGASLNNSWRNYKLASSGSEPDIAVDSSCDYLHTTWTSEGDIYYCKVSLPLDGKTYEAVNVIDDSSGSVQSGPSVYHFNNGSVNRTIIAWTDARNADSNNDYDIYFASVDRGSMTNILATVDSELNYQSAPVAAANISGAPYIVFQEQGGSGQTIQMACASVVERMLSKNKIDSVNGGYVGVRIEDIDSVDDVTVIVPAGALNSDVEMSIARVSNPPGGSTGIRSLFSYDFGPSSTREFRKAVNIVIPYPATLGDANVTVFWYNPQTGSYSQSGMSNIETLDINSELKAISFETTHFSQYSVSTEFVPWMVSGSEAIAGN